MSDTTRKAPVYNMSSLHISLHSEHLHLQTTELKINIFVFSGSDLEAGGGRLRNIHKTFIFSLALRLESSTWWLGIYPPKHNPVFSVVLRFRCLILVGNLYVDFLLSRRSPIYESFKNLSREFYIRVNIDYTGASFLHFLYNWIMMSQESRNLDTREWIDFDQISHLFSCLSVNVIDHLMKCACIGVLGQKITILFCFKLTAFLITISESAVRWRNLNNISSGIHWTVGTFWKVSRKVKILEREEVIGMKSN